MSEDPEERLSRDDDQEDNTLEAGPRPVPRTFPSSGETSSLDDVTLEDVTLDDVTLDSGSKDLEPGELDEGDPTLEVPREPEQDEEVDMTLGAEEALPPQESEPQLPAAAVKPAAPTSSQPADAPQIADLHIDDVIGRGGQGVVYRGRQVYLDRAVAVKVLAGNTSSRFQARFQREAKILAGLQHPHVVSCYQAGVTDDGRCFMIMELIDGPDLFQWIQAHGALTLHDALTVGRDIAQALEHGHKASIIHRDVKPQNVLLARSEGAGELGHRAKLADLGLARGTEEDSEYGQLTAEGAILGTPATMAPEQFDDPDRVDFRADIYGLGCVLFQALTGEKAFQGRGLTSALKQKIQGDAPDPKLLREDIPEPVAGLVRRMLAPDRDARHASYAELITELESLLEGHARGTLADGPREKNGGASSSSGIRKLIWVGLALTATAGGLLLWPDPADPEEEQLSGQEEPTEPQRTPSARSDIPENESSVPDQDDEPETLEVEQPQLSPQLAPGEEQPLFTSWPIDTFDERFMADWKFTPEDKQGKWGGAAPEDLHTVMASTAKTPVAASYPLPAGDWSLQGNFEAGASFGAKAPYTTGVALLWSGGARLEVSSNESGRRAWSLSAPLAGIKNLVGPGEQEGGQEVEFRLEYRQEGAVTLSLEGDRVLAFERADLGIPIGVELFVTAGKGLWWEFALQGL